MVDIRTNYMGLSLKSPIIVGASGLTFSVDNVVEFEKQGAGAVVLKSLFEEEILHEINQTVAGSEIENQYPEAFDYISNYSKTNQIDLYLKLISDCKKSVSIPVIASICCVSTGEWISFAEKIQHAGADALELNIFSLPSDPTRTASHYEQVCFDVLEKVKKVVRIPVALKIGSYFSNLAAIAQKLSWSGADALVLFNRFYSPDLDIEELKLVPAPIHSSPRDIAMPLRWTGILSHVVQCDLAATTGIHSGNDVIKLLLAGAKAVQVVSAVYQNGPSQLAVMLNDLKAWMEAHRYLKISDFNGKLSQAESQNPAAYERVQFMKYFSGIE